MLDVYLGCGGVGGEWVGGLDQVLEWWGCFPMSTYSSLCYRMIPYVAVLHLHIHATLHRYQSL